MEFTECATACPAKCNSISDECTEDDQCIHGCECPGNKVIGENGDCVEPMDCYCKDDEEKLHKA